MPAWYLSPVQALLGRANVKRTFSWISTLLQDKHDRLQLTNITHRHLCCLEEQDTLHQTVRTEYVCVCVSVSGSMTPQSLQLCHHYNECLRGILQAWRVTGCVTALAIPCRLREPVWHQQRSNLRTEGESVRQLLHYMLGDCALYLVELHAEWQTVLVRVQDGLRAWGHQQRYWY